jgi:murein DD-endopeptidase MepM/ murein hydrolase activator NlpD
VLVLIPLLGFQNVDLMHKDDSLERKTSITLPRLTRMIDSVLDLPKISSQTIDLINRYAGILNPITSNGSQPNDHFNLNAMSFDSSFDEKMLFPLSKLDSLPACFELNLENKSYGSYLSPCKGIVTSNFGWRDGRLHKGIDIDLNKGDQVFAAFDGKVRFANKQGGFGNVVIIMHPNGLETVYAHLSKIRVKVGDVVLSGQSIGLGGNTGHSRGSHLHFEIHYLGYALNPGNIISFTDHKLYHEAIAIKNLKIGLCAIPVNKKSHTVTRGESWNFIANKYGLSTKELLELNGTIRKYPLKVGQALRIM